MTRLHRTRRQFLKVTGLGASALVLGETLTAQEPSKDRPNILWLVSEDNGPFFGCYGDKFADTPNLDKFAAEGILYKNAFANAPVCAPARSTIITGMYASSMGTHHMRSRNPIPKMIKFFTQYLRQAGYYCTNRAKEDYNVAKKPAGAWDESSGRATYKKRKAGQPFFAVINHGVSHESGLHRGSPKTTHDQAKVKLPPYHPDTPEFRHDWAQYYDKITALDGQIGKALKDLAAGGLAENTIVIYYADHGGVLPRSKRFLYDSGMHVPMIARFPKKYQHLATDKPGTRTDRLVSFVDLAPTVLSLAGIKIPKYMQGVAFLGKQAGAPREYVYGFRGRMDERYDMMRAVRDKKFKYIRNYMPHLPWAQYLNYLWRMPAMKSWQKLHDANKLTGPQKIFFQTKPMEELYDVHADPHEVNNLAGRDEHGKTLQRMRDACRKWLLEIHDTGFCPEAEMLIRSKGSTPYEMARDAKKYAQEQLMAAADLAGQRDPKLLGKLIELLKDKDSGVRYWGAVGCLAMGDKARDAAPALTEALQDSSPSVRITAAEALCGLGQADKALPVLAKALGQGGMADLHAANALDNLDEKARPVLDAMTKAAKGGGYVSRAMQKAVADLKKVK